MSPYAVVPFERFGGLDLAVSSDEASCVDALNIELLNHPGLIRVRSGYTSQFTPTAPASIFRSPNTGGFLVGDTTTNLRAYNAAGTLLATQANFYGSQLDAVSYHTPTAHRVYAVQYQGAAGMVEWDGASTLTSSAALGAVSVAVTPWDNRLVRAATTTNGVRVFFSDAGAPTTFGANNYVDLAPGGGTILAVRSWRESLFAFKNDRYFVFTGTNTDSVGNPIFAWREVNTNGVGVSSANAAVAGREGVYFVARDGVYVAAGGQPVKISGGLEPLFRGEFPSFFQGVTSTSQPSSPRVGYAGGRFFMTVTGDSGLRVTFVYYPERQSWSFYSMPISDLTPNGEAGFYFIDTAKVHLHTFAPGATTDDGTAISSRFRQGFWTPDGQVGQSVVREMILEGTGTVTVKPSTDWGALGTGTAVALGTSPAVAEGRWRPSGSGTPTQGRHHSYEFSGTGAWTLHRAQAHISARRPAALA